MGKVPWQNILHIVFYFNDIKIHTSRKIARELYQNIKLLYRTENHH